MLDQQYEEAEAAFLAAVRTQSGQAELATAARTVAQAAYVWNSGYSFYLLDPGSVSVKHEGREVRTLGDFFGEIAILGEGRRTATVTAIEPGVAWSLFGTSFRTLQAERPDVADALQSAMTQRLAAD